MSDGGAAAIVEIGSMLGRTRAGRVVLLVLIGYFSLQYVVASLSQAALVAVGVVGLAALVLVTGFVLRRRRRKARASLRDTLAFLALVVVAILGALFLLARRRKGSVAPPPDPRDVDRLAQLEAHP